MEDLTIIYLTASLVPEKFAQWQRAMLPPCPVISVSRKPLDFGINVLDTEPKSYENIYKQMLHAAKIADTKYVAIAEDDCLYPLEHWELRPDKDTFLYNQNRYALFTWGEPTYNWRNRKSNCSLIAPRELMIEALEERFAKHPNGMNPKHVGELGRKRVEEWLKVTPRKSQEVFSNLSIIQINHDDGTEDRQKRHRKSLGHMRAYDIPLWGKASELIKTYYGIH